MKKLTTIFSLLVMMVIVTSFTTPDTGGKTPKGFGIVSDTGGKTPRGFGIVSDTGGKAPKGTQIVKERGAVLPNTF